MINLKLSKGYKKSFLLLFLVTLFFGSVVGVQASGFWNGLSSCKADGSCGVNDFVRILVNISTWMLAISGSLTLLAFVYGGVLFIISGGNSDLVAKAKKIIFGAVIGIVIVFASYSIISFVMTSLGYSDDNGFGNWESTKTTN